MKPAVGRIVHYYNEWQIAWWPHLVSKPDAPPISLTGPFAAIVLAIVPDSKEEEVRIRVMFPNDSATETTVKHASGDVPTPGRWNWPPRD